MRNNQTSSQEMLQHAKDTLAQSHNRTALTVALLDISAALDDCLGLSASRPHSRSRSRHYDINNYREMPEYKAMRRRGPAPRLEDKLRQLRRDGIISLEESNHIEKMRDKRNAAAHGRQPNVTYDDLSWYRQLVENIITGRRKPGNKARNAAKFNAQKFSGKTEKAVSNSTVSSLPTKQEVIVPPPTIQNLPDQTPQPVLSQPAQANDDVEFLSELLQQELGRKEPIRLQAEPDNNELLRQLLS